MRSIWDWFRDEEGATAVEYAVMLALILVACLVGITAVSSQASALWGSNQSNITQALTGGSS